MKDRLILIYQLSRIDKELQELNSLKGDIPAQIEELNSRKYELEGELTALNMELAELEAGENALLNEIEALTRKIDKDDNILRSGGVRSNQEYNALAKEIEDGYEKIEKNEKLIDDEYKSKRLSIKEQLGTLQAELDEVDAALAQKLEELKVLTEQTAEEEKELNRQKHEITHKIDADDLEYYERINRVKFGDAVAIVRKGSCLGCFNSIPPQRVIEIKLVDRFFHCESCGRILVSEEFINS